MSRNVVVIGAGIAGLTVAYRLLLNGQSVRLIERGPVVGGQLITTEVGGAPIEHYYHHAFTSDHDLWELCEELGIHDVKWCPSTMGYFSGGVIYPFGTPESILKFKPLGWLGKVQLVVSTLWITYFMSQRSAEYFSVKEWFYKWGFKSVWDVIWRPLFQLKFDQDADAISLVWLWGKLHTRGTSRKKGAEVLGYLPGSFGRVALVLQDRIRELGGTILLNTSVHKVIPIQDRFSVETSDGVITADRVISTQSADILATTADWSPAYKSQLLGLRYKAATCMMIISSHPWLDRYWVNIGDDGRPFGGMIAHTNLVSSDDYGGKHILYLSRYLDETNPLFQASNDDLIALFCEGVHSIIPEFDRNQVDDIKVFRQRNAQPVVPKGYQNPSVATEIPGFDWISTHHTYPFDRGMNYAVQLANQYSA